MFERLKQMNRALRWAAKQVEKQRVEEARRQMIARTFPPGHSWKVTREALEWEAKLQKEHPWHRDPADVPPLGAIPMGDLIVITDTPPVIPQLVGLQAGPMPQRYRAREESDESRASRIFEERFGGVQ
jgi:hypothetical protein